MKAILEAVRWGATALLSLVLWALLIVLAAAIVRAF